MGGRCNVSVIFLTSCLTYASPIFVVNQKSYIPSGFSHLTLFWASPFLISLFFTSSALSSCHSRVYQSLANLIRWADQVMLDGIDLEDKENVASVTTVIKAVLDGVKVCLFPGTLFVHLCCFYKPRLMLAVSVCEQELVKLTIEKQEHPSPTTPNKPAPPAATAERWVHSMLVGMQMLSSFN